MAKLIQQINNMQIKKYTKRDPYYLTNIPEKRFLVVTPYGKVLEDRLTLDQARAFATRTKDFTIRKNTIPINIDNIRKKLLSPHAIENIVGGLLESQYSRAPTYGERAWRVRGKKRDLIVWDTGNSNYEAIKIIKHR